MTLVNSDTGEVVEFPDNDLRLQIQKLEAQVAKKDRVIEDQQERIAQLKSRGSKGKGERNREREFDPYVADCNRVYEHWREKVAPNAREFGDKRFAVVRARLNAGYPVDELLHAIDGAANMPTEIRGRKRQLMLELEYICRNEKNVDMFLRWAAAPPARRVEPPPARASNESVLVAALRYIGLNWPVFPCRGKKPLIPRGLLEASTAREKVETWWSRWPDAQVAVRTGTESGLMVLDVDGAEGFDSLSTLEQDFGVLPRTASVKTPRGGQHYYFKAPAGGVRNSAGLVGANLDIRADGGYVIAPPSCAADGRPYAPDDQVRVAEPPPWLVELLREARRKPAPPVSGPIPEGERNAVLASLAGSMRRRGMGAAEIGAALKVTNQGRCQPPLTDCEVDQVAGSIARYEPQGEVA